MAAELLFTVLFLRLTIKSALILLKHSLESKY